MGRRPKCAFIDCDNPVMKSAEKNLLLSVCEDCFRAGRLFPKAGESETRGSKMKQDYTSFNLILEDDSCVECPMYRGIGGYMVCLHPGADEETMLKAKIPDDPDYVRTPDWCPLLFGPITINKRDYLAGCDVDHHPDKGVIPFQIEDRFRMTIHINPCSKCGGTMGAIVNPAMGPDGRWKWTVVCDRCGSGMEGVKLEGKEG